MSSRLPALRFFNLRLMPSTSGYAFESFKHASCASEPDTSLFRRHNVSIQAGPSTTLSRSSAPAAYRQEQALLSRTPYLQVTISAPITPATLPDVNQLSRPDTCGELQNAALVASGVNVAVAAPFFPSFWIEPKCAILIPVNFVIVSSGGPSSSVIHNSVALR
eukprot:CAMPEP_0197687852 /NCGR_PEP_ID=MMETSP1338-20131121/104576_1 /TAXON_ID=43686 ORGANISM="Pelagodinium beii, Strain RCC1491" /NCGR_SAMPLE_ID=MMETSP1338 /ASSEMBLY_ACC=CAM_ASM_000754 /LENGTH=162 /DNA_ID=CAMNT_0043270007 /DNA_START=15 /DNA_END=504 /DNA_ORIENTATION=+